MATKITDPGPDIFQKRTGKSRAWIQDEWLDGDVWRLVVGEDTPNPYNRSWGAAETFVNHLRLVAKQRGQRVRVRTADEADAAGWVIYVQAYVGEM